MYREQPVRRNGDVGGCNGIFPQWHFSSSSAKLVSPTYNLLQFIILTSVSLLKIQNSDISNQFSPIHHLHITTSTVKSQTYYIAT